MIYVITPVFNRVGFTRQYLEALENQTVKDFKTIIVDDCSTDGTAEMIEFNFPDVVLLKEKGDLWWAEATNIGVKFAIANGATHIITLNDDTVPENDFIEKMMYWSSIKPNALLGAAGVSNKTNKIIFGGKIIDWKNRSIKSLLDSLDENELYGLHEVNFFPGRGLLIPSKIFDEIGFYDSKNFPQTIADLDFTHRAYDAGYKIFCNYDAKIMIYEDESANSYYKNNKSIKNYIMHLFSKKGGGNIFRFIKYAYKNCPKEYLFLFILRGLFGRLLGYWQN